MIDLHLLRLRTICKQYLKISWVQSRIKSAEDATVAYKFNPQADFIGNIITSLNANTNLKNDIFGILLGGLEINEAEKCRV